MNRFEIYCSCNPSTRKPFRIIETQVTIDGPRSRICDGSYETVFDAQEAVTQYCIKLKADSTRS